MLDRAKKQINGNTDITFDYELKKTRGRAFDTIILYSGVAKPDLKQMEIDFNGDIEKQKEERGTPSEDCKYTSCRYSG